MNARKLFLQAIDSDAEQIDLAYCALLLASELEPGVQIDEAMAALQSLSTEAGNAGVNNAATLVDFLSGDQQFHGNTEDYYAPQNSLLDQVLRTRQGIPITLAIVYISIGEALGLEIAGISFPGHFLLAMKDADTRTLIDPFRGQTVSEDDCYRILANLSGAAPEPSEEYFATAHKRHILLRVAENLKGIYARDQQARQALVCLDYQLLLMPDSETLLQQQQAFVEYFTDTDHLSAKVH